MWAAGKQPLGQLQCQRAPLGQKRVEGWGPWWALVARRWLAAAVVAAAAVAVAAAWPWLKTSPYTGSSHFPSSPPPPSPPPPPLPPFITLCVILHSSREGTQKWGAGKITSTRTCVSDPN